jgi:hypothetical protein
MFGKLSKRDEKKLQESGVRCQATVLEIAERGMAVTHGADTVVSNTEIALKARLRVDSEVEPSFEVHQRFRFPQMAVPGVGSTLPVIYDPNDHDKLMIDRSLQGGIYQVAEHLRQRGREGNTGVDMNAIANALESEAADGNIDKDALRAKIKEITGGSNVIVGGQPVQGSNPIGVPPVAPIPAPGFPASPQGAGEDPVDKLAKLQELKEKGALTDAEFEAQKARILGE